MRSTFIRILSIVTLATSISAFGLSEKASSVKNTSCNDASAETTKARAARDARTADDYQEPSDNSQEKARKQMIKDQEKQWLHDVQNIIGG